MAADFSRSITISCATVDLDPTHRGNGISRSELPSANGFFTKAAPSSFVIAAPPV
jgi:hypothetical protein